VTRSTRVLAHCDDVFGDSVDLFVAEFRLVTHFGDCCWPLPGIQLTGFEGAMTVAAATEIELSTGL
jgi:hypothetical protein